MYLPILTYHRLLKESPDKTRDPKRISVSGAQFRSHLAALARLGYRTVSLGEYTEAVEMRVREAGYEAAFATDRASPDHAANLFALRRVVVFPSTNVWQLLWKVQTWYPAYQDLRRKQTG